MRSEFAFTRHDTPALRQRIESDLATVVSHAIAADPHLRALVLTGGFSRGEGTTRDDAPVNDYDLVAIRDAPGPGPYASLHASLSRDLGIEVDLMPIWRLRLPYVGRKLFWLDVRLGAKVIWGDEQALASLRPFDTVEPSEVPRLLGNRAAGLLLSLPGEGETPDEAQRDLQATKAVLAAMDAHLLQRDEYVPTMEGRLALTTAHRSHAIFREAVAWKLGEGGPAPRWDAARDVLLAAVADARATAQRDGLAEHALHAIKARRLAASPSQAMRRRAWALLEGCSWPEGPVQWRTEKRSFFAARAQTLQ